MRVFIAGAYSRYFVFDWLVRERERKNADILGRGTIWREYPKRGKIQGSKDGKRVGGQ